MAVLSLEELATSEIIGTQEYGLKSQGLIDLIRLRDELHLNYAVPEGFVVPVSGTLSTRIEKALLDLTAQDSERVVLLARSSSPNEEPGKFATIPVIFDPSDKKKSFQKFLEAYENVIGGEPKAVIGQKMVGDVSEYDGRQVFGLDNTSFILQAPSFNPDQIAISCARGLAGRVVGEDASKIILIDYDFIRRDMVRALDKPDRFYEESDFPGHRQTDAECFDLAGGSIVSVNISKKDGEPASFGKVASNSGEEFTVPFKNYSEIDTLAKIALALKDKKGKSIEVEGAYVNGKLHLFQLRELETTLYHHIELSEGKYIVGKTDMVIGSGRHTLDLAWFVGESIRRDVSAGSVAGCITELMRDYQNKPFFAYTDYFHGALITQLGESCRIVGTSRFENTQSHTVGVVRKRIAQGKIDLYLNHCPLDAGYFHQRSGMAPDKEYAGGAIQVWKNITIESDGRMAQLFFEGDDPQEARKYKLDGLEVLSLEQARQKPGEIAGKVILDPQYDVALHISGSGNHHTIIVHGKNIGWGESSKAYTLGDIEKKLEDLAKIYILKKV